MSFFVNYIFCAFVITLLLFFIKINKKNTVLVYMYVIHFVNKFCSNMVVSILRIERYIPTSENK